MAKVTVNGKEYDLRFDLDALEQVEQEYGSLKGLLQAIGEGKVSSVRRVFVIMANCYRDYAGEEASVTEAVLKHAPMSTFKLVADAIKAAIKEGMRVETANGGPADDDVHDGYLDEIDEKNG